MNRTLRILILLVLVGGVVGGGIGLYLYNKPHQDLSATEAYANLGAADLFAAFEADEAGANSTYLDKLVSVQGRLAEISETQDGGLIYMLRGEADMFGVNCAFLADQLPAETPAIGTEVRIKGLVIGMDMDVNLSRCVLVK